jgi:hypothetical protein
MDKLTFEVNDSVIRIVGIFEASKPIKLASDFAKQGFILEEFSEQTKKFYKDYWYPEFRDLLFFKEKETSSKILAKSLNQSISFKKGFDFANQKDIIIEAEIGSVELILFPNELHFFSIELKPPMVTLSSFSLCVWSK